MLSDSAIEAALNSDWQKAIEINKAILKQNPNDLEALNRLGYALLNSGEVKKAQSTIKKVLKIDPSNPIALKNLKKTNGAVRLVNSNSSAISPRVFLEEPGITKTINLVRVASKSIVSSLVCGQQIFLKPKRNRLELRTENTTYIGALPDDISYKLRRLLQLGNKYCVFIKSIDDNQITVIIHETQRGKRVKDASFSSKIIPDYHTSIRSELLEELLEEDVVSEEGAESSEDEE